MVTPGGFPLEPSKLIMLIILSLFCMCEALAAILTSIVLNSHFGKRPGAGDMTVCSPPFLPHVNNKVLSY